MAAIETLVEKLAEVASDVIAEQAKNYDFGPHIDEAVDNYNMERAIEDAVERYDFDEAIDNAVREFDFTEAIDRLGFDHEAEKAVEEAVEGLDLDGKVEEAVDQLIAEKLPSAIEKALFVLLERPDVQERLVATLFDRAAS